MRNIQLDCVRLLLNRGADPNAIDFDSRSALDWCNIVKSACPDGIDSTAVQGIERLLVMQTYRSRPVWKDVGSEIPADETLALFPVARLQVKPRVHFVAPLRPPRPVTGSLDSSRRTSDAGVVVERRVGLCQHCDRREATVRCIQCGQQHCDRCCVQLHTEDSRKHHIVSKFTCVPSA